MTDFIMTLKSMSVLLRRKQKIDLICHFKKSNVEKKKQAEQ